MARKITAPFTLTEQITLTSPDTFFQDTVDIASYISVGSRQALQVHKVDYVYQSEAAGVIYNAFRGFDTNVSAIGDQAMVELQLTDLNRGAIVTADDSSLVSSGQLRLTVTGDSHSADLYPDNYKGPEGRTVVNDQLYFGGQFGPTALDSGATLICTVRLECQIVELSTADWMAIAIQSTAADN
tara:strand:- start:1684 stop:2235 length:552 start_codon:yes stop_codon:yes gene_type:complete